MPLSHPGSRLAHRYVYSLYHPLEDHQDLDHLCRNRRCVNPDHLEIVTRGQNVRRGALAKLTWDDVAEIRRLAALENRPTWAQIAEQFNTTVSNVSHIVRRKRWNVDSAEEAYGGGAA